MAKISIVTNLSWPAFRNVALDIQKAIKPFCESKILDWKHAKPKGNIIFLETVRKDTFQILAKFLPGNKVIFYGTTEGHAFLDLESFKIAKQISMIAVSNFVKQMLEEVNLSVSGVVHHGVDLDNKKIASSYVHTIKKKAVDNQIVLTIASNNIRKGLGKLVQAYCIVGHKIPNSFLILHSEPYHYYDQKEQRVLKRYYNLSRLASEIGKKKLWLTECHGLITSSEVNSLYKLCQVYALPSFCEGFGLPMLEAFRFNKPIVALNCPPFNEVIENGKTGILIPYEKIRWINHKNKLLFKLHVYEPEVLAEALVTLLSDSNLRKKMESEIKIKKHHWSIHNLYPKLLEYF